MSLLDYKSFLYEMQIYEAFIPLTDAKTISHIKNPNLIEFLEWCRLNIPQGQFFVDEELIKAEGFTQKLLRTTVTRDPDSTALTKIKEYVNEKTGWSFTDAKAKNKEGLIVLIPYPPEEESASKEIKKPDTIQVLETGKNMSKSGLNGANVVLAGTTTPQKLMLNSDIPYKDAQALLLAVKEAINASSDFTQVVKNWLIAAATATAEVEPSNTTIKEWFDTGDSYTQTVKGIPDILFDKQSKAEITKNYGEVLDAIFLLAYFVTETGVIIPKSSEPLVDLYIDDYQVSAKDNKGGGSPSIKTIVSRIVLGNIKFDDPDEQALADILISPLVVKNTAETEFKVFDSYFSIAETLAASYPVNMKAYLIFKEYVQLADSSIKFIDKDKKALEKLFDDKDSEAVADENYVEFLNSVFDAADYKPRGFNEKNLKKSYNYLFIALCKEIGVVLSEKYQTAFQGICNKTINIKQAYLNVDLKNDTLEFEFYSSQNLKAVFNANKSIPSEPYNSALSFSLKKQ